MSKYCPQCLGEFKSTVNVCPRDNAALTHDKPPSYARLIDFYSVDDKLEAEHVISLLNAEGIVARESVGGISQLPVASDTRFAIAVLREDLKRAKAFIEQARQDGVIADTGSFC